MFGGALASILISLAPPEHLAAAPPEDWRVQYVVSALREGRLRTEIEIASDGTFVEHNAFFDRERKTFVTRCADRRGKLTRSFTLGWAVDQSFRESWEPSYRNKNAERGALVVLRIERGDTNEARTTSLVNPFETGAAVRPDGLNFIVTMLRRVPQFCGLERY
ncbi:MAG: hypothetical protein NVSMB64_23460 [Candidatus Velthaea sp.]